MSNKVFKNYQVNLGGPFMVEVPDVLRKSELSKILKKEVNDRQEEVTAEEVNEESSEEIRQSLIQAAEYKAQSIVKEAEYQAAKILEDCRKEIEKNKASVLEEAQKKGYEQGEKEAKEYCREMTIEAEKIRQEAMKEYSDLLSKAESDVVDIILDIARKVIGKELSDSSDSILQMIRQAFESCSNRDNLLLFVSPIDYEVIEKNSEKLKSMVEGIQKLEVKVDPALAGGNFTLRTPYGNVEGGADKQLKKIEEAFKEVLDVQGEIV